MKEKVFLPWPQDLRAHDRSTVTLNSVALLIHSYLEHRRSGAALGDRFVTHDISYFGPSLSRSQGMEF